MRITETVKHLLIINVIFFLATRLYGDVVYDLFALHFVNNPRFIFWQPLSHMFMHGSFNHIFFNMFGLAMFGSNLEMLWGRNKFLFFYLSTGLGAAVLQSLIYYWQFNDITTSLTQAGFSLSEIQSTLEEEKYSTAWLNVISQSELTSLFGAYNASMVGASGALYGVLVAFAMLFPNAELFLLFIPVPVKAKYLVPVLILGDLFFGFSSYSLGPIAHFAHLGGALTGFLIMRYWKSQQFKNNRWDL